MFKKVSHKPELNKPVETATPLKDRIVNAEATVLGFVAEHSLSFALVPSLIDFAKKLSADKKALNSLQMSRTTASYKTRFGLSRTFEENLLDNLRSEFFSLNLDESTSSNLEKVLTILVSYCCPERKQVVINHFASLTCVMVDSKSLYNKLVTLFQEKQVPWKNLMSVLMDSCNVMRGSKSGLERRIREGKASHLLDVDGDICHHVHNASKSFCKPFNYFLERLLTDLFTDSKWSPDIREMLQEVCTMLGTKYTMPQRYVSHRWLSVFDVSMDTQRLFDALTVFYFAWIPEDERTPYLPVVVEIYKRLDVSNSSRTRIREIRKVCFCKS